MPPSNKLFPVGPWFFHVVAEEEKHRIASLIWSIETNFLFGSLLELVDDSGTCLVQLAASSVFKILLDSVNDRKRSLVACQERFCMVTTCKKALYPMGLLFAKTVGAKRFPKLLDRVFEIKLGGGNSFLHWS